MILCFHVPILFPELVTSNERYWVISAKRRSPLLHQWNFVLLRGAEQALASTSVSLRMKLWLTQDS
jgi:hypothetical protein